MNRLTNKKTKILHYCLMTSDLDCKIKGHPQEVMKKLGITYQHATPQSIGDCWWFWNCENIPEKLPKFLTEKELDPMECIGYGLNKEMAEEIRDYDSKKIKKAGKVNFRILERKEFEKEYPHVTCDFHPDSPFLMIKDEEVVGHTISWCAECLWKLLKEHRKGQWTLEKHEEEKS